MRTPEQIVDKIENSASMFGFEREVWLGYLTFAEAKHFLKKEVKEEDWGEPKPLTREQVLDDMRSYADFGWGKILDHRGISANRTVEKMEAWMWLLEDEEALAWLKKVDYAQYGAPKLKWICEHYDFPWPKDDGAIVNMTKGLPCQAGCLEGCGR
jgi:hypothetical protein